MTGRNSGARLRQPSLYAVVLVCYGMYARMISVLESTDRRDSGKVRRVHSERYDRPTIGDGLSEEAVKAVVLVETRSTQRSSSSSSGTGGQSRSMETV